MDGVEDGSNIGLGDNNYADNDKYNDADHEVQDRCKCHKDPQGKKRI